MSRYAGNLVHWKTHEPLVPTTCYSGDEFTDDNTRLMIEIRELEHELEQQNKNLQPPHTTIERERQENLEPRIRALKRQYKAEKDELIKNASYEMFPDHTLIHCQLISHDGKNIKADGSFGNELVWCKVSDQRCFYSDILYAVNQLKDLDENGHSDKYESTRASLTNWPMPSWAPQDHLSLCDTDDSVTGPNSCPVGKVQKSVMNFDAFLTRGICGMDQNNLAMAKVMVEEGMDAAAKKMFEHPTDKNQNNEPRKMSYSEMRSFYG